MRICQECGTPCSDNTDFCPTCGTRLTVNSLKFERETASQEVVADNDLPTVAERNIIEAGLLNPSTTNQPQSESRAPVQSTNALPDAKPGGGVSLGRAVMVGDILIFCIVLIFMIFRVVAARYEVKDYGTYTVQNVRTENKTYYEDVTPVENRSGSIDENILSLATLAEINDSDHYGIGPRYSADEGITDTSGNMYNVYFSSFSDNVSLRTVGTFYSGQDKYYLGGEYATFECRFILNHHFSYLSKGDAAVLIIYGDDVELARVKTYKKQKPKDISVDVRGVETLRIVIQNEDSKRNYLYPGNMVNAYLCKEGYSFQQGQE